MQKYQENGAAVRGFRSKMIEVVNQETASNQERFVFIECMNSDKSFNETKIECKINNKLHEMRKMYRKNSSVVIKQFDLFHFFYYIILWYNFFVHCKNSYMEKCFE